MLIINLLMAFSSVILGEFAEPPTLKITRDDHVATLEMDFNETAGWGGQLWNVSADGTEPIGYKIQWWPDPTDTITMIKGLGCSQDKSSGLLSFATEDHPHQMITANHVVQLQPLANDVTYHVSVSKLNSLGEECSAPTLLTFEGGDGTRVQGLQAEMTFFDDFNLEEGPADELLWNNAMTPQTDPRFNLFFINPQCHSHTLNGTLNGAAGDKSQVAQRPRKPILIENDVRRRIVFDMDGLFSGRSVWYLDLNPVNTDLTGHMSFFDADGDKGLPADVLRLRAARHELSAYLINSAGESRNIARVNLAEFGRGMNANVRRSFDVRVGTDGIQIYVDGVTVLDEVFDPGAFKAGVYYPLWSTIGYNTSKDDNPYFLSHWDNFGFDGPDIAPYEVRNYVTRIIGTDLQDAHTRDNKNPTFTVNVPDDIRPLEDGVKNDVYLVFTYLSNNYSSFEIAEGDYLMFNGVQFSLPLGENNSSPLDPDLISYAGSTISNRIKVGEVRRGETSPLLIGDNAIQFFATNTGIVNLHIEVLCPKVGQMATYTQPKEIHSYMRHHHLPKLGPPAKIRTIDGEGLQYDDEGEMHGGELSGIVPIEAVVGNTQWADWGPQYLNVPAQSAEIYSTGNTEGISKMELFLRAMDNDTTSGFLIKTIATNIDAPSPQVRYEIPLDTRKVVNGEYELFLRATNSKGVKSHPSYHGFGFEWDASELSGAFKGVNVTVNNPVVESYTFLASAGIEWTKNESWNGGLMPPYGYGGLITIQSNCQVPTGHFLEFSDGATINVMQGVVLEVK